MLAAAADDVLASENEAALRRADEFVGRAGDRVNAEREELADRLTAREAVARELNDTAAPFVVQQREFFCARDFDQLRN